MMFGRIGFLLILCGAFSGCASNRYPVASPLSQEEAELLDCDDIEVEMIRAEQTLREICEAAEDVASDPTVWWIGVAVSNFEAFRHALDRLTLRVNELDRENKAKKCEKIDWEVVKKIRGDPCLVREP